MLIGAKGYRSSSASTLAARLAHYSMPEPNSGCHLWLGCGNHGYGDLRWNGRSERAHRLAWINAFGAIPEGLLVCHRCDVRACINPAHLFLGTHAENNADRDQKNRQRSVAGTLSGNAKLTDAQVWAIRNDKRFQREIAAAYGISRQAVGCIKRRETWAHLEDRQ